MKSDITNRPKKKARPGKSKNTAWIFMIFFSTVIISAGLSIVSDALLTKANLIASFCILLVIVLIGILFDIIGVAVTAADFKPFHSMAAHRVRGAQEALSMLRNADKVSSFCNDVIGDICGVVSGTASAAIAAVVISGRTGAPFWFGVLMAALVSGVTVGGKAIGKSLAMAKSTQIVHLAARVVFYAKYMPDRISKAVRRWRRTN